MSHAAQAVVNVPFHAHVELLQSFLARRGDIVERVQELLNAQRKPPQYLHDTAALARLFEDCYFTITGLTGDLASLRRQLDEAHWADGFKPRQTPGQPNDLVDPAELMSRAFLMWQRTRWPGYDGRVRYAQALFNLYLLRRLMLLAMRIFDDGEPGDRLAQVQGVLDDLGRTTPAGHPVFLRDASWLFALAQSPTTDALHGYFDVAQQIAETLAPAACLRISSASVRMAGGHLRSQLRHVATQNRVALDDHALLLSTRKSNALDLATLIQGLVPLLDAYERAAANGDTQQRLAMADAICQGISPDPELFVNRLDLLGPYSMIEYLFIAAGDGSSGYTPLGERHLRLLHDYAERMTRLAKPLYDDCLRFRPVAGSYSPYGALYGFSSQLLDHMGLKASQPEAATGFSLEDVFSAGGADKLAWVSGWRKLPHVPREVARLFEYPQSFADETFARVERALQARAAAEETPTPQNGRLFVGAGAGAAAAALPIRYVVSSDRQVVAERKAQACDEPQLLHSRTEGELLVSYPTAAGWVGISKDVLTDVVGAGRDASLGALPPAAARTLQLMCPDLVSLAARA